MRSILLFCQILTLDYLDTIRPADRSSREDRDVSGVIGMSQLLRATVLLLAVLLLTSEPPLPPHTLLPPRLRYY